MRRKYKLMFEYLDEPLRKISILIFPGVLLAGCLRTEGTLKIEGRAVDEHTGVSVPGREIIVQGLVENDGKNELAEAGWFLTDTSGNFTYSLGRIKDARYYNFCLVGDSDYASATSKISLFQLKQNAKYLSFPLKRLAGLTINILKVSNTLYHDTLYLSWESGKMDFRTLYPYQVDNHGLTDNSFVVFPGLGIRWIGGDVNSTVTTRVFAGKTTILHWEMVRNKNRKEYTDTIVYEGDRGHSVYFKY